MSNCKSERLKKLLPFVSLPLILLMGVWLWLNLNAVNSTWVGGEDGVWDLREFDFENDAARIGGHAEFIPNALLSPEEFAAREDEAIFGRPDVGGRYSFITSRTRLLLPDGHYTFSHISTHWTDRIYVNGHWLRDVGVPADNPDDEAIRTARVTFTAHPENGVIEIVQQVSNFSHRVLGNPQNWTLGNYAYADMVFRVDYTQNIMLGFYLTMALVFFMLFAVMGWQRHNLYFALFCFMWFLRTGATGSKVFSALVPWLSGAALLRIEYLAIPVSAALCAAVIFDLFPNLLQKFFMRAVFAASAVWGIIFLFGGTMFISHAVVYSQYMYAAFIAYVVFRFIIKARKLSEAQIIFIAGLSVFLLGVVYDIAYFTSIDFRLTVFNIGENITRVTILVFTFCQAVAVFISTMQKMEELKTKEQEETEKRRAADEKNAANENLSRMKTEFLSAVSHELRTPLTVISNNAQLARMHVERNPSADNDFIVDSMRIITSDVERMAAMVKQLQDASRIEEGHMGYSFAQADIAALIIDTMNTFRPELNKKSNALTLRLPEGPQTAHCDRERVRQVLLNLATNANRFTKGGMITVSLEKLESTLSVSVADTGEGIPEKIKETIFERYTTANPERNKNPSGTGLGLYIAKHIIEAHGGTISAKSEKGQGTVMTFTLPICEGDDDG